MLVEVLLPNINKLLKQQELSLGNSRVCFSEYIHIPIAPHGTRRGGISMGMLILCTSLCIEPGSSK